MTITGNKLPVPQRLHTFPSGLSPDARLVAGVVGRPEDQYQSVVLGPVRGGSLKTVLRGSCINKLGQCGWGADPTFAWSPDSHQLAATVKPLRGSTVLKLFDRRGVLTRTFRLPAPSAPNPDDPNGPYFRLLSWSPDGARLLLTRSNSYGVDEALVVIELASGRLRRVSRMYSEKAALETVWSPNGRYVALTHGSGFDSRDYIYAVIEVSTGRAIVQCTGNVHCDSRALQDVAWAPDSRSLLTSSDRGIERVDLAGRRSTVVAPATARSPLLAFGHYVLASKGRYVANNRLLLVDLATGESKEILSTRRGISAVVPLTGHP